MTRCHSRTAGRKNAKTPAAIPLQRFTIDCTVMAKQLRSGDGDLPINLELATAAFDSEGVVLNSVVNEAAANTSGSGSDPSPSTAKLYRAPQHIDVPLAAASLRIAVQDANTGRLGVMEIILPLPPETHTGDAEAPWRASPDCSIPHNSGAPPSPTVSSSAKVGSTAPPFLLGPESPPLLLDGEPTRTSPEESTPTAARPRLLSAPSISVRGNVAALFMVHT